MEEIELVVDAKATVGEGPVWHDGAVWWVDIVAGEVHRYDPATGGDETFELGQEVGALVPRASGGFVLAVRDGFAAWDGPGAALELLAPVERDNPDNRMNDGKCDRAGRFWASTMEHGGKEGQGSLYRLDPDLTVTSHLDGLAIGNGLAWSADDERLYYIDSLTGGIDVLDFDLEAGRIANRTQLVKIGADQGLPDGMTIDSEGCLWVAMFNGGCVRRYTPAGSLDRTIELPVTNVTCCAFGGDDLGDLYITTATNGLDEEQLAAEPQAGGLFVTRPGATGTAPFPFRG